jgi:hypothetical protein
MSGGSETSSDGVGGVPKWSGTDDMNAVLDATKGECIAFLESKGVTKKPKNASEAKKAVFQLLRTQAPDAAEIERAGGGSGHATGRDTVDIRRMGVVQLNDWLNATSTAEAWKIARIAGFLVDADADLDSKAGGDASAADSKAVRDAILAGWARVNDRSVQGCEVTLRGVIAEKSKGVGARRTTTRHASESSSGLRTSDDFLGRAARSGGMATAPVPRDIVGRKRPGVVSPVAIARGTPRARFEPAGAEGAARGFASPAGNAYASGPQMQHGLRRREKLQSQALCHWLDKVVEDAERPVFTPYPGRPHALRVSSFASGPVVYNHLTAEGTDLTAGVRRFPWKRDSEGNPSPFEWESITLAEMIHAYLVEHDGDVDWCLRQPLVEVGMRRLDVLMLAEQDYANGVSTRREALAIAGQHLLVSPRGATIHGGLRQAVHTSATQTAKYQRAAAEIVAAAVRGRKASTVTAADAEEEDENPKAE